MRICLVTEEVASAGGSGGIGGAIEELAILLSNRGAEVDVLCAVAPGDVIVQKQVIERFARKGVALDFLDVAKFSYSDSLAARSLAVYSYLVDSEKNYDFIHFHEYHGIGYFVARAKRQGIAFTETQLVVQCHGSVEWALECNAQLPSDDEHLQVIHMEKESIAAADILVSPSAYLIEWMKSHGYKMPAEDRCHVIQNVCTAMFTEVLGGTPPIDNSDRIHIDEIIMFGRHEPRKGFVQFVDGLGKANKVLAENNISVTFLGGFGKTFGQHSGAYLAKASRDWSFNWDVIVDSDRYAALGYLRQAKAAAVFVPSPAENSPYTVLEALALGKPLITSSEGGARELIHSEDHAESLISITSDNIGIKIMEVVEHGARRPRLQLDLDRTEQEWFDFHEHYLKNSEVEKSIAVEINRQQDKKPKVVLGITHYERPEKLLDSVMSAARQTYSNLEIVVLDDGSKSESTLAALEKMSQLFTRTGIRLIKAENGYLGAARNKIAAETQSEYLCFLDDDDVAHPELVETLVSSAIAADVDVMNCLNVFMPESRRNELLHSRAAFSEPVSYVPTAGPLELAPKTNVFGAATALIRRSTFEAIGGYTELKGVGHEDYEFFVRVLQDGFKLDVTPKPLYLYEVDRPSMVSKTSTEANFRRVVESLDTSKNPDAWKRLLMRFSGETAKINEIGRKTWESRLAGLFEFESALFSGEGSTYEQLDRLVSLSNAVGSDTAVRAFSRALNRRGKTNDGFEKVLEIRRAVSVSPSESKADLELFDARLEYVNGNIEQSLQILVSYIENRWSVNHKVWNLIDEIIQQDELNVSLLKKLRDLLLSRLEGPTELSKNLGILFKVLIRCGDRPGARKVLEYALEEESVDYLRKHADVNRAVEAGIQDSAIGQFARSGVKQKRDGFPGVRSMLLFAPEIARQFEGDLRRYLGAIARYLTATS
ncbi:glycosyltransferase [Corynebacterium casei]|uniref:glycosyltransferase n=1 Tax=Corynebacterium casei TaxID=160386 RepID=UPI003FCFEA3C